MQVGGGYYSLVFVPILLLAGPVNRGKKTMLAPAQDKLQELVQDAIDKVSFVLHAVLQCQGLYDTAQFYAAQLAYTSGMS